MCVPYSTYLKSSMEWGVASGISKSSPGQERWLDANHAMKVLSSKIQVSPEVQNTFSHWGVPQTQKKIISDSQGLIATGVLPATCLLQQNLLTHLTVMSLTKCSASTASLRTTQSCQQQPHSTRSKSGSFYDADTVESRNKDGASPREGIVKQARRFI